MRPYIPVQNALAGKLCRGVRPRIASRRISTNVDTQTPRYHNVAMEQPAIRLVLQSTLTSRLKILSISTRTGIAATATNRICSVDCMPLIALTRTWEPRRFTSAFHRRTRTMSIGSEKEQSGYTLAAEDKWRKRDITPTTKRTLPLSLTLLRRGGVVAPRSVDLNLLIRCDL